MNFFINETFNNNTHSYINDNILNTFTNYKRIITDILENVNYMHFKSLKELYTNPITESSTNIFLDTNRFIIDNFIKNLKDIKKDYENNVKTFFSYNKKDIDYIKSNKKEIYNFNGNSIKITGYYFTEFKIPPVYIANEVFDDMVKVFDTNIDEVYNDIKEKFNSNYMSILRKDILETSTLITKKEFHKRTYEYFRNGVGEPETINIGINYIKDYIDNLDESKYIKSIKDFIDEIIDQLNCVKDILEDFIKSEYIGNKKKLMDILHPYNKRTNKIYYELDDIENELDENFNNYLYSILRVKSMLIIKIMEIYGEILSCKISAMDEAIVQNKFICIVLLDHILNKKGEI